MTRVASFLAGLALLVSSWSNLSAQPVPTPTAHASVVLKWLGTTGWEIQIGQTVILIDPFLTRGETNPGTEWKTDEEAVLRAIKRADYIFAGHSHADHIVITQTLFLFPATTTLFWPRATRCSNTIRRKARRCITLLK